MDESGGALSHEARGYSAAWPTMNSSRFEVVLQISSRMVDILLEQVSFFPFFLVL